MEGQDGGGRSLKKLQEDRQENSDALDWDSDSGGDEKRRNLGISCRYNPFSDGLHVGCERERGVRETPAEQQRIAIIQDGRLSVVRAGEGKDLELCV